MKPDPDPINIIYRGPVHVRTIDPPKDPIRESYGDEESLHKLAASIEKFGQLQAIGLHHVKGTTRRNVVWGNRRLHVIQDVLGLDYIDAVLFDGSVSDASKLELAIQENEARLPPTEIERAKSEARLKELYASEGKIKTKRGVGEGESYAKVRSQETGESERTINRLVAVGEASPDIQDAVERGVVTIDAGAALANAEPEVAKVIVAELEESGAKKVSANAVRSAVSRKQTDKIGKEQHGVVVPTIYGAGEAIEDHSCDLVFTNIINDESDYDVAESTIETLFALVAWDGHLFIRYAPDWAFSVMDAAKGMGGHVWTFAVLTPDYPIEPNSIGVIRSYHLVSWFALCKPEKIKPIIDTIKDRGVFGVTNDITHLTRHFAKPGAVVLEAIIDGSQGNGAELHAMGYKPVLWKVGQEGDDILPEYWKKAPQAPETGEGVSDQPTQGEIAREGHQE